MTDPRYKMAGPTRQQRSTQSVRNAEHWSCHSQALPPVVSTRQQNYPFKILADYHLQRALQQQTTLRSHKTPIQRPTKAFPLSSRNQP